MENKANTVNLTQRVKHYEGDRGFSSDVTVLAKPVDGGLYEVKDANNAISTGQLQMDESGTRKVGVWEAKLPNGHTVFKEYDANGHGSMSREPAFNKNGEASPSAAWLDDNVKSRQEFDANHNLVKDTNYQPVAKVFQENKQNALSYAWQTVKNTFSFKR